MSLPRTRRSARMRSVTTAFVALVVWAVASPSARADDGPRWRGAVAAGTEFPVSVGVRGQIEAPFRLRLSTSFGILPGAYIGAINGTLVGLGAYDQATADLISDALGSSLIWRTHVGYRPFAQHGLTVEAGYGLVALGGGASASTLVAAATGSPPPDQGSDKTFAVSSALHMLDVEVGWEWQIFAHLFLRASVGGAFTLGASSGIAPDYGPRAPRATEAFSAASAAYLDRTYTSYVFTPVVSLWAGYAF